MTRRHYLAPLLGTAPLALLLTVGTATAQDTDVPEPGSFTSSFRISLAPDDVVNAMGEATPGEAGASGTYDLRVNSVEEVVCYAISIEGVSRPFMSPARTATHLHQGPPGAQGPARIVFPDPVSGTSEGCLSVPTTVGLPPDGPDAGAAFSLKQLEADPSAFYADLHTAIRPAGALRAQVGSALPSGGVATGAGGSAGMSGTTTAAIVLVAGAALGGTALAVRRRATA